MSTFKVPLEGGRVVRFAYNEGLKINSFLRQNRGFQFRSKAQVQKYLDKSSEFVIPLEAMSAPPPTTTVATAT
jgi:hypothetical protein